MKKNLSLAALAAFLMLFHTANLWSQDDEEESTVFESEEYIAKTGLSLVPLPEFMYDPFVGLYVGVNSWIFDYGDGKKYPNYYQSLNLIAAYGTKGKTNFSLKYTNYADQIWYGFLGYTHYTLLPFYGANGYQSNYYPAYTDASSDQYITKPFYNYDHGEFRASMYVQDTIGASFFNWKVGFDVRKVKTDRADIEKMNKGVDDSEAIPDVPTLYDRHIDWGLIGEEEKDGGWANSFIGGMVYDSRDRLTNPMSGMWSEVALRYSPSFMGNHGSATQVALIHRQYFTLVKEKLSFAYRLRYDAAFGELPYYARFTLADETMGIGGGGTLWGINQNRIVARQYALANFELRAKVVRFRFINQNWYIGVVPLFHTGYMIDELDVDFSNVSPADRDAFFNEDYGKWYHSAGIGAKIVMNENTVIGIDWAKALNEQAGGNALYIGMGYSF